MSNFYYSEQAMTIALLFLQVVPFKRFYYHRNMVAFPARVLSYVLIVSITGTAHAEPDPNALIQRLGELPGSGSSKAMSCPQDTPADMTVTCKLHVAESRSVPLVRKEKKASFSKKEGGETAAQAYLDRHSELKKREAEQKHLPYNYSGWVFTDESTGVATPDLSESRNYHHEFSLRCSGGTEQIIEEPSAFPGQPPMKVKFRIDRTQTPATVQHELWNGKEWVPGDTDIMTVPFWHTVSQAIQRKPRNIFSELKCNEPLTEAHHYRWEDVWSKNYAAKLKESKDAKKPLLIYFTGKNHPKPGKKNEKLEWCAPCATFVDYNIGTKAFLDEWKDKAVFVEVDAPSVAFTKKNELTESERAAKSLMEQYEIDHVPSFIVVTEQGWHNVMNPKDYSTNFQYANLLKATREAIQKLSKE